MELKQIKGLLHQTKCGEMFMDGMGCSEPILTQADIGLMRPQKILCNRQSMTV